MASTKFGSFVRIDNLRDYWPHEAHDFTKWLAQEENLAILSREIGIEITLLERESSVGSFNVDLFAVEEGTGRKIIIENQLEDTNHDHLGKIITYASGKGAEVIIWIVKRARDEHRQAIEWLNQHTDENIGFFLVEIELWKINDSLPAPKFNIVEKPNAWVDMIKTVDGLTDLQKLQLEYWQAFADYAFEKPEMISVFSKRKPYPQNWYSLSVGSSTCNLQCLVNTQKNRICSSVYISNDKELFEKFYASRSAIEDEVGMKLEWHSAKKDCRIVAVTQGNIKQNTEKWNEYFEWYCEMAIKLRKIVQKYGI